MLFKTPAYQPSFKTAYRCFKAPADQSSSRRLHIGCLRDTCTSIVFETPASQFSSRRLHSFQDAFTSVVIMTSIHHISSTCLLRSYRVFGIGFNRTESDVYSYAHWDPFKAKGMSPRCFGGHCDAVEKTLHGLKMNSEGLPTKRPMRRIRLASGYASGDATIRSRRAPWELF